MPLPRRTFAASAAAAFALALAACSEGVQLEGKLFDWMGVSGASLEKRDPKMPARPPLVVPPDVSRLPEPGSGKSDDAAVAALKDPELQKEAAAKERQRLHLAYCRGEIQWKERALSPDQDEASRSPYGPCPGLLSGITDSLTK